MASNKGINNAQNVQMDQNENAVAAHLDGGVTFASLSGTQTIALPGHPIGDGFMWFSPYFPATGYNVANNDMLQTGLEIDPYVYHFGWQLTPSSSGPNGEQDYQIAPSSPGSSPPLNMFYDGLFINYVVDTAAGVAPNDTVDLLSTPTLADFDFKLEVSASGPSFLHSFDAIFDLSKTPAPNGGHSWTEEGNPSVAFGGGDLLLAGPYFSASPDLINHIAEGKIDLAGLTGLSLAALTTPGNTIDIKLVAYAADSTQMATFTHDKITIVAGNNA